MSEIFSSEMHIDSALHLIEESRYLLSEVQDNFDASPEGKALIEAETALCIALKGVINLRKKDPTGIDLSAFVSEAKRQRNEKQEAQEHNSRMKLALENYSKEMSEEIKAMFAANGFEVGMHCSNRPSEYGHYEGILISICSGGISHPLCWVAVDYEKYHKLSTGETFPLLKGQPYMGERYSMYKVDGLKGLIEKYPSQITAAVKWCLKPSVLS